ncbi:MAG: DUF692 domain-containing protein [Candidatus Sericytochromatia bacterium]
MQTAIFGVGLRAQHYARLEQDLETGLDWFEILTENHLGSHGRPRQILEQLQPRYPLGFHGVALNIASHEPLDFDYLTLLRDFIRDHEPILVSDHLCWTGLQQANLHNLLPIPYNPATLDYLAGRIRTVQDFLGREIALENLSAYVGFTSTSMSEWDFLAQLAQKADCYLLVDINNLYVNAVNHGFDPRVYLDGLPAERIVQYHLAGYSDTGGFLFDTHSRPVYPAVWELYAYALKTKGMRPTLIEWDEDIPDFATLEAEALKARKIWEDLQ